MASNIDSAMFLHVLIHHRSESVIMCYTPMYLTLNQQRNKINNFLDRERIECPNIFNESSLAGWWATGNLHCIQINSFTSFEWMKCVSFISDHMEIREKESNSLVILLPMKFNYEVKHWDSSLSLISYLQDRIMLNFIATKWLYFILEYATGVIQGHTDPDNQSSLSSKEAFVCGLDFAKQLLFGNLIIML